MDSVYSSLIERTNTLKEKLDGSLDQHRIVVAFAGPPGSGKTTIADNIVKRLNASSNHPFAAVVPMDGFHLSRAKLDALPDSAEAYARRGASWTFDERGVLNLVKDLSKSRFLPSTTILAPSFDHALKDPAKDGIRITPDISFVVLEGNYLLLAEEPWCQISELVDDTWFVDVDPQLAKERIAKRHIKSGIETTWEAAVKRAEGNDLLNGIDIRNRLLRPAIKVQSVDE